MDTRFPWAGTAGLGLAIVKQIMQAHGGWLKIESLVGKGTTNLPLLRHDLLALVCQPYVPVCQCGFCDLR